MAQPTAVTIPARSSTTPVDFTWTAGVVAGQITDWMPGDILLVNNTNGGAQTVTVLSSPKSKRGTDSVTAYSLAAGDFAVLPRFPPQDADTILVTVSHVDVKVARLSTKAQPV